MKKEKEAKKEEVVQKELDARAKLFSEAKVEMEDKVWRSYGILKNARILSLSQLLNLTSAIRLGIERKVIDVLKIEELNILMASALQGSVAIVLDKEPVDEDMLDIKRADIVRSFLRDK